MKFRRTEYGALTVLAPNGELAGDEVDEFRGEMRRCLEEGHPELIVDCAGITSFDSAGLEALTELLHQCVAQSGALKLCGLDGIGRKVFEMTRLEQSFDIYGDVEAAIRSYT